MSEPATTSTIAISAGTVTLTGSIIGMQYDTLLFGFVGVLFSLRMLPPMTRAQLAIAVISTVMLAALSGPITAYWLIERFAGLSGQQDLLARLVALLVGAGAQLVFPAAIAFARKRLGGDQL